MSQLPTRHFRGSGNFKLFFFILFFFVDRSFRSINRPSWRNNNNIYILYVYMYQEREVYTEGRASTSEVMAGGRMGVWGCWAGGGSDWAGGQCPLLGDFVPVWLKKSQCDLLCHI